MSSKNSIQVCIKMRPLLMPRERDLICKWQVKNNSIQLVEGQADPYCFDYIFDQDANNQVIFEKMAKHIIHACVQGFNGTIFAYGQTSSGKTYTMMGDEQNPGVMVLAAKAIFKEIQENIDRQFLLRVGYIEIYNEKIYDLLNKKNQDLSIHVAATGIVNVNCEECIITSEDELLHYLCMGNKERTVGETNMNERSSRSHAIFRIIIESRKTDRSEEDTVIQSVLNLVDLAGSERADQTGATGTRLKEGGHINKSLLFLSNVIKRLSENEEQKFISYRDSKLTRILQASLGGNALTSIICTIKPTIVEETQSTLNFALRAKSIKNKPQLNEIVSEATMMKRLEREIKVLKLRLDEERQKNESQLKVGQLEQRIKTDMLKIISCNSLNNVRNEKEKRRRTWCPTTSMLEAPGRSNLKKPSLSATNTTGARDTVPKTISIFHPSELYLTESDEMDFEPAEKFNFEASGSQDFCTPDQKFNRPAHMRTVTMRRPILNGADSNGKERLDVVEQELLELQEYTNLEKQFNVDHESYSALKSKMDLLTERNAILENERLVCLQLNIDFDDLKESFSASEKRCDDQQIQISKLTKLNHDAYEKIANYEQQLTDLNKRVLQLERESQEATNLEFDLKRQLNKSKLRENELVSALDEKELEIKSSQQTLENELSKHKKSLDDMCVNCEDLLQRKQDFNENFERLTADYDKLQRSYKQLFEDAGQKQIKFDEMSELQRKDAEECLRLRAECITLRGKVASSFDGTVLQEEKKVCQEIEGQCEELNAMQIRYDNLEAEYLKLEQLAIKKEDYCQILEKENKELQLEIQDLTFRVESAQRKLLDVPEYEEETNNEYHQQIQKLRDELAKTKQILKDFQMHADVETQRHQTEMENSKALVIVEYQTHIEKYRNSLDATEKKLHIIQAKHQIDLHDLRVQIDSAYQAQIENLKEHIDICEKRIEEFVKAEKETRDKYQSETEKLKAELENKEALIADSGSKLIVLQGQHEQLLNESEEKQKMYDDLQREYDDLSNQLMDILQEYDSLRQAKQDFEENAKKQKTSNDVAAVVSENTNIVCSNGFDSVYSELTISTQSMDNVDNNTLKIQQLEEVIRQLQKEIEEKNSLIESTEKTLVEMREQMTSLTMELLEKSVIVDKVEIYQKQIETLEKERAEITINYEELQDKIKEVTICESNNDTTELPATIDSQLNKLQAYKEQFDQQLNEIADLNERCLSAEVVKAELQTKIEELQIADDTHTSKLAANSVLIDSLQEEIAALNERSQADELVKIELNAKIEELQKTVDSKVSELTSNINLIDRVQGEVAALNDFCSKLHKRKIELEAKLQEVQTELLKEKAKNQTSNLYENRQTEDEAQLGADLKPKNSNVNQSELETEKRNISALQSEVERMKREMREKEKEYTDEVNRINLDFYEKLEVAESEFRENLRKYNLDWEAGRQDYETQIAELKTKLHDLAIKEGEYIKEREDLVYDNASLKQKVKTFQACSDSENEQTVKLTQRISNLEHDLEEKKGKTREFEELLISNETRIETLNGQITALRKELEETKSVYDTQVKNLQLEKQELEIINSDSIQTIETLKSCSELHQLKANEYEQKNIAYEKSIEELKEQRTELDLAFIKIQAEKTDALEKLDTLQEKMIGLVEEMNRANSKYSSYAQLIIEHEDTNTQLTAQTQKCEQLVQELEIANQSGQRLQVELQLKTQECLDAQVQQELLRGNLEALESKLHTENSDLKHQVEDIRSAMNEMQLKYESLQEAKSQLEQSNVILQAELNMTQEKINECECLRTSLGLLQTEFTDLENKHKAAVEEATRNTETLRADVLRQKQLLQANTKETEKLTILLATKEELIAQLRADVECMSKNSNLLLAQHKVTEQTLKNEISQLQQYIQNLGAKIDDENTKQLLKEKEQMISLLQKEKAQMELCIQTKQQIMDSFRNDKERMQATISSLSEDKRNLGEKLVEAENVLRKYENEIATLHKSGNTSIDSNNSIATSPGGRRSLGESTNNPLKLVNVNIEDKLFAMQQKSTQMENECRRNRRLSTHDERRRQAVLCTDTCDVGSNTDGNDCKCAELETKLKSCERRLLISDSQVGALKFELKNHPMKSENAQLLKRLQEEQDKNRVEIMRYKNRLQEMSNKKHSPPKVVVAHRDTQTDAEVDACLQKLQAKYNDLTTICRERYQFIKELEGKINQKENADGNAQISALEAGQMQSLKKQCEKLKKENHNIKEKYENAKAVLLMRRAEIDNLRAEIDKQRVEIDKNDPNCSAS